MSWSVKLLFILLIAAPSCAMHRGIFGSARTPHTGTHATSKAETALRLDIVNYAKKHVGAKYKYGGTSPTGFDCSGFTSFVLKKFELPISGPSSTQEKLGKKISKSEAQPGDLVFFRRSKSGRVFHVAIVYANNDGNLTLVHSTTNRGVVMDDLNKSSYWRSKYMTVRDVVSN